MYYVCSLVQSIEAETEQDARDIFERKIVAYQFDSEQISSEPDNIEE